MSSYLSSIQKAIQKAYGSIKIEYDFIKFTYLTIILDFKKKILNFKN